MAAALMGSAAGGGIRFPRLAVPPSFATILEDSVLPSLKENEGCLGNSCSGSSYLPRVPSCSTEPWLRPRGVAKEADAQLAPASHQRLRRNLPRHMTRVHKIPKAVAVDQPWISRSPTTRI